MKRAVDNEADHNSLDSALYMKKCIVNVAKLFTSSMHAEVHQRQVYTEL